MKKTKKRILSLALCLAMMTAMFSLPAFAAGDDAHDHDCDCSLDHAVALVPNFDFVAIEWLPIGDEGIAITAVCPHIDLTLVQTRDVLNGSYGHTTQFGYCIVTKWTKYSDYDCKACGARITFGGQPYETHSLPNH